MKAKEILGENFNEKDLEEANKNGKYEPPTIIEYEDMTEAQQRIVDAGLSPVAGSWPSNLSKEERMQWMMEQVRKAKNEQG